VSAITFGSFVLDLDTRELRSGSESVPLTPKAYQLLEVLVVKGKVSEIREVADALVSVKGVKHGKLTMTTTGKGIV